MNGALLDLTSSSLRVSGADSFVFFLQNEAAKRKWPVTERLVQDIQRQFK